MDFLRIYFLRNGTLWKFSLSNVLIRGESNFDEKNVEEMFNWSEVHSEKKYYLWNRDFSDLQNFCSKFSSFSLEFQTFFSITRTIFLTLGQNNFGNKTLFFYFSCHFSGRQLWSANSGIPHSISTPKRHLLFARNPGQYMSKVGEGHLHRGKSILVILCQINIFCHQLSIQVIFCQIMFWNSKLAKLVFNLCKSS